jgi:hypothetical protein
MEATYRVEGNLACSSALAGGPWDPKLQHGAAPAALVAWAVERVPAPVPMRVVRLTLDLMRPVPVAPLVIETEVLREGRKIQLVAVRLLAEGKEVVRASALRVRRCDQPLPAIAGTPPADLPGPDAGCSPDVGGIGHTPFLSGIAMRTVRGSPREPGPAAVWYRAGRSVVAGAAISPLMRAAITADFCNGTSSVLDFNEWTFINGDLTLSLAREPVGEWILLDAETWAGPDSIGLASARLADCEGYFGRAVQSLLFERRPRSPEVMPASTSSLSACPPEARP